MDDFFYVTVSNGIGGALFLNGALYTGPLGNVASLATARRWKTGARAAGDGKRGCLEAHAAGRPSLKIIWSLAARRAEDSVPPTAKRLPPARGQAGSCALHLCAGRAAFGRGTGTGRKYSEPGPHHTGRGVSPAYDVFGPALEQALGGIFTAKQAAMWT